MEIENNIKKLEKQYYVTKSAETLSELNIARTSLRNLIMRKAERDVLLARRRLFESASKPNRFLARLARNTPSSSFITAIVDVNGERQVGNRQINECFREFYTNLYQSEMDITRLNSGFFLNDLVFPQLSEDQVSLLESPITLIEVDKAISALQSGKCPGADGFPVEFF